MFEVTTAADLRRRMSFHLMRTGMHGTRLLITRNNRDFAALMPVRDLDAIEKADKSRAELEWSRSKRSFEEYLALKKSLDRHIDEALDGARPRTKPFWED